MLTLALIAPVGLHLGLAGITLAVKLRTACRELGVDSTMPIHEQLKACNEAMGLQPSGTLLAQADELAVQLGLTFDDVVVLWNRCAHLDEIEEAVLMTRSRDFGLTRPLAEAVLEVVETDPNPAGAALEYIVVAKLPRALAEVRALA